MKSVYFALAASVLVLSGCASRVTSDVTTFHEQMMPAGETIRVVPADPANEQSLEFRSYATRISEELRRIGYTPIDDESVSTELVAEVDYAVRMGPAQVYTDRSQSYGSYYFGFGRYYNPWYFGFYDPLWNQPQVYSVQTYQRSLEMNIFDRDDQQRVFEGRVESNGTESALPAVMPYLITAMFENFPGESGSTKLVTIEKDTKRLDTKRFE